MQAPPPLAAAIRPAEPEESTSLPASPGSPGLHAGQDSAAALRLLDEVGVTTNRLRETHTQLASLIRIFRPVPFWRQAWYRLTGQLPEREVFLREMCIQAERLADQGLADTRRTARQLETLGRQRRALRQQQQVLEREIRAGRLQLSSAVAQGLDAGECSRLTHRLALQEALDAALRLTQSRCRRAIRQARAASASFDEVLALLRLRWRQRLGFELFAQRMAPHDHKRRGPIA